MAPTRAHTYLPAVPKRLNLAGVAAATASRNFRFSEIPPIVRHMRDILILRSFLRPCLSHAREANVRERNERHGRTDGRLVDAAAEKNARV